MLASIMNTLAKDNVNVENMTNKSKGNYAYTVVDVGQRVGDVVADEIRAHRRRPPRPCPQALSHR